MNTLPAPPVVPLSSSPRKLVAPGCPPAGGFTLIELLTVIAIIGILAAILIPTVGKVRSMAAQTKCLSSLRSTFTAAQLYSLDNRGIVVPGSTKRGADNAKLWSESLVTYYGQVNNAASATFSCPKWEDDKVTATAYNWGYAMNVTPGFEGSGSNAKQKGTSTIVYDESGGRISGASFLLNAITHPTRRLFFCDSNQWHVRGHQVTPTQPGGTLASYNRHGAEKCNVIFFDGHAATLSSGAVDQAIYDPGQPYVAPASP